MLWKLGSMFSSFTTFPSPSYVKSTSSALSAVFTAVSCLASLFAKLYTVETPLVVSVIFCNSLVAGGGGGAGCRYHCHCYFVPGLFYNWLHSAPAMRSEKHVFSY